VDIKGEDRGNRERRHAQTSFPPFFVRYTHPLAPLDVWPFGMLFIFPPLLSHLHPYWIVIPLPRFHYIILPIPSRSSTPDQRHRISIYNQRKVLTTFPSLDYTHTQTSFSTHSPVLLSLLFEYTTIDGDNYNHNNGNDTPQHSTTSI